MDHCKLENKSIFDSLLLREVVRKTITKIIDESIEDISTFFVSEDSFLSQFSSSIDPSELIKENSEIFYKIELYPLQNRLINIQQTLKTDLRTIIGGARAGNKPSDVSVLADTPQYYILYDKVGLIKKSLNPEYDIPYTVTEAHRVKAGQILDRLDIKIPSSDAPIWIIRKPENWYDGQWTVIQTLSHFIQYGMSPTEALDYFMITIMNAPVRYWANVRGKTKDAIYKHVREAKDKINPQAHPTEPSDYDYTGRTYRNAYVEDTEYMTVDNGFLHPRRDIMNASLSGKMTSGYSGAGPKQLAVAILADLYGDAQAEQLAQELVGQLQHLASSDEDGTWELSEEQLQQWYWSR